MWEHKALGEFSRGSSSWSHLLVGSAQPPHNFCFYLLVGVKTQIQKGSRWQSLAECHSGNMSWLNWMPSSQACHLPLQLIFFMVFSFKWDNEQLRLWCCLHLEGSVRSIVFGGRSTPVANSHVWVCWLSLRFTSSKEPSWLWAGVSLQTVLRVDSSIKTYISCGLSIGCCYQLGALWNGLNRTEHVGLITVDVLPFPEIFAPEHGIIGASQILLDWSLSWFEVVHSGGTIFDMYCQLALRNI